MLFSYSWSCVFTDCYHDVPEINCSAVDGYTQYADGRCLASRDDNTTYLAGVWDAQLARDDANIVRTFSSRDYFKYETAAVESSSKVEQFTWFYCLINAVLCSFLIHQCNVHRKCTYFPSQHTIPWPEWRCGWSRRFAVAGCSQSSRHVGAGVSLHDPRHQVNGQGQLDQTKLSWYTCTAIHVA